MRRVCIFILAIFLLTILAVPASAVGTSYNYESVVDEVAEVYIGKTVPGACVIVAEHGNVVFSKGYGYADIEKKLPMDPNSTVFEWGSITKTFVWVSVMQQVEAGHIELNKDISEYLPDKFLKNRSYDTPITMLDLMNHTAGFSDQLFDLHYHESDVEQPLESIMSVHQPKQVFEPGTISAYSNWGAALAALIVERVSNQDFAAYVNEHVLSPLSMSHTAVQPHWSDHASPLENKAIGYSFSGSEGVFRVEDWMYLRMYPAGSTNGPPIDLLKYANKLAKETGKSSLLFQTKETKSMMFSETYRSFDANAGLSHDFWQYPNTVDIIGHEGGTYGFKTQFWVEPETEPAIIIMTNVMETEFCSKVMQALVNHPAMKVDTQSFSAKELHLLEGDYLSARCSWRNAAEIQGRMQAIQISATKDGTLRLKMPFGMKEQIYR